MAFGSRQRHAVVANGRSKRDTGTTDAIGDRYESDLTAPTATGHIGISGIHRNEPALDAIGQGQQIVDIRDQPTAIELLVGRLNLFFGFINILVGKDSQIICGLSIVVITPILLISVATPATDIEIKRIILYLIVIVMSNRALDHRALDHNMIR